MELFHYTRALRVSGVVVCSRSGELLAVTTRHLDDLPAYGHELPVTELSTAAALRANAEHHLIACAAGIPRTIEHVACEREQDRVVVERCARVAPERGHGFAKGRIRVGGDFEAQHVTTRFGAIPRARVITR